MQQIFLVWFGALLLAQIGYRLAWRRFTSNSYTEKFTPHIESKDGVDVWQVRRRMGYRVDATRTFIIAGASLIILALFINRNTSLATLFPRPLQIVIGVYILQPAVYYSLIGPYMLASKHSESIFSKKGFKEYILPYIARLPSLYAIAICMLGLMVVAVYYSLKVDIPDITVAQRNLTQLAVSSLSDLQRAVILLVEFGERFATTSQKYVVVALIGFLYLILEQRTTLKHAMTAYSMDFLKAFVWVLFIVTLGFALLFFPGQYQNLHTGLEEALIQVTAGLGASTSDLDAVITVQAHLEDHDLTWLLVTIGTGYGNLAILVLLGGGFVLWRMFYRRISAEEVVRLLIPIVLIEKSKGFLRDLGMEIAEEGRNSGSPNH